LQAEMQIELRKIRHHTYRSWKLFMEAKSTETRIHFCRYRDTLCNHLVNF